MHLKKLYPYALTLCLTVVCSISSTMAQDMETRGRQVARNTSTGLIPISADDLIIISEASPEEIKAAAAIPTTNTSATTSTGFKFQQLISSAIDQRLGSPYSWGATGPSRFDCSGFVWSTFQSAGIDFERSNARTLWARFAPATPEDKFKFGTLVFFSGLKHIGIVADEHGFYHASRHHGVVYSPFNDYWLSRIDGFRRVPLPVQVEPTVD